MNYRRKNRNGLTLVELLIVIAIIGVLIQITLPAIESSREAARQSSCINNLRQIGLAAQLHHNSHGHLPTGGWMPMWVGDPLRGFGRDQPGGWIYNILPYIGAEAIHNLPDDGDPDRITDRQKAAAGGMVQIPLAVMQCPSRRLPRAYTYWLGPPWDPINADKTEKVARSDYAANGGDHFDKDFPFYVEHGEIDWTRYSSIDRGLQWASTAEMNGVCFVRSEVSNQQITDGLSKTYLVGEKYLNPSYYTNGVDPGDNHSMYQGFDRDIIRWADSDFPPLQDREKKDVSVNFGSVHPTSFNVVLCDGSVQRVAYDLDPEVHRAFANRHDEKVAR